MKRIVLGSRSPRRRVLLERIVPAERIEVVPPKNDNESGFHGLASWTDIDTRLLSVARTKCRDVRSQIQARSDKNDVLAIVTADTTIVATTPDGQLAVLEQPPDDDSWMDVVRDWFVRLYAGRTHTAATGLCVATLLGQHVARVVKSQVTFHSDVERWLDWYLATCEPLGKAGGYGIQGAADIFVAHVRGSISNVVGLPLRELIESFEELGIHADRFV